MLCLLVQPQKELQLDLKTTPRTIRKLNCMKSDNQECKEAILIWTGRRVGVAEMGGKAVAAEEGGMGGITITYGG